MDTFVQVCLFTLTTFGDLSKLQCQFDCRKRPPLGVSILAATGYHGCSLSCNSQLGGCHALFKFKFSNTGGVKLTLGTSHSRALIYLCMLHGGVQLSAAQQQIVPVSHALQSQREKLCSHVEVWRICIVSHAFDC